MEHVRHADNIILFLTAIVNQQSRIRNVPDSRPIKRALPVIMNISTIWITIMYVHRISSVVKYSASKMEIVMNVIQDTAL